MLNLGGGINVPTIDGVVHALTCVRQAVQMQLPGGRDCLETIRHQFVEPLTTTLFGSCQGFVVGLALNEVLMNSVLYGEHQPIRLTLAATHLGRRPLLTFTVTDQNQAMIPDMAVAMELYPDGHELEGHRGLMLLRNFVAEGDLQGVMTYRDGTCGSNVCTFSALLPGRVRCHHRATVARRQRNFSIPRQLLIA